MEKNKIYRAEIIAYAGDGSSIARIHDMVVFVPGGAVGDQCDIRIVKIAKNYAYGRRAGMSACIQMRRLLLLAHLL